MLAVRVCVHGIMPMFAHNENICRVVMVLGAGRGPLVTASMNAARKADIKIRVYAVEKNPNAVVTYVSTHDTPAHSKSTVDTLHSQTAHTQTSSLHTRGTAADYASIWVDTPN